LLLRIISSADQVIINGDFWDSRLTTAQKFFFSSAWQPLFKLLKEKNATYMYGNHDTKESCRNLAETCSSQQYEIYEFKQSANSFHIEHGNRIAPDMDETRHIPHLLLAFATLLDGWATRLFGRKFLEHYKIWNEKMQHWQQKHLKPTEYLVTGHSHYAEHSPALHFANSGSIRGGQASYLLIENGHVILKREKY